MQKRSADLNSLHGALLAFTLLLSIYGTHRFLLFKMVGFELFPKIVIGLSAALLLLGLRYVAKDFFKTNLFSFLCLTGAVFTGYVAGSFFFVIALFFGLLIHTSPRPSIDFAVAVIASFAIFFSLSAWCLFFLMANYSGDLSFCHFNYDTPADSSNLRLLNFLGLCHWESREYFGFTVFRQRSFGSEPARMIGYILFPIALAAMQSTYPRLKRFCITYFPVAALPSLSVNILFVILCYVGMRLAPLSRAQYFFGVFIFIPILSILLFSYFDHTYLSNLLRHSEFNQNINVFSGSTTRRFEYFDTSLKSVIEALPFGGVNNVSGNLPVTLMLNYGLFGAAAYVALLVRLKKIITLNIDCRNGQLAFMACFFPIMAINASGHFLAPSVIILFLLGGQLVERRSHV